MNRIATLAAIVFLAQLGAASALDYTQLNAVKLLRSEKRFDEAIQKLEAMAAQAGLSARVEGGNGSCRQVFGPSDLPPQRMEEIEVCQ